MVLLFIQLTVVCLVFGLWRKPLIMWCECDSVVQLFLSGVSFVWDRVHNIYVTVFRLFSKLNKKDSGQGLTSHCLIEI